jgi:hypothetical protein
MGKASDPDETEAPSVAEAIATNASPRSMVPPLPTPRDLLPHIPIGHPDSMMSKESVRKAVEDFRTRPTDVIVATFPKTGTTLVTWICHLLRTNAAPIDESGSENSDTENSFETLYEVVPWPTLSWDIGYDPNVQGSQFEPRVFKSHLRMASIYPGCRYVVTIRDPAKTTLSFYNFFLAKKVPFLVDESSDDERKNGEQSSNLKLKMDVSTFLVDTPFIKGSPKTPTSNLRASMWDYYAEYHALLECPSVLILVYEDFLSDMHSQIHRLSKFIGTTTTDGNSGGLGEKESGCRRTQLDNNLIDEVAAMSTKDYMAGRMSKFDEPYERAKALNRAADISQLAPGAKIAVQTHPQKLDATATQFLEDQWRMHMEEPLGYGDYEAFAAAVRERNQRLFG